MSSVEEDQVMEQQTPVQEKGKEKAEEPTPQPKVEEPEPTWNEQLLEQFDMACSVYRNKQRRDFLEAAAEVRCQGGPYLGFPIGSPNHFAALSMGVQRGYDPAMKKVIVSLVNVQDPMQELVPLFIKEQKQLQELQAKCEAEARDRKSVV